MNNCTMLNPIMNHSRHCTYYRVLIIEIVNDLDWMESIMTDSMTFVGKECTVVRSQIFMELKHDSRYK